jgi:hypothetical protein
VLYQEVLEDALLRKKLPERRREALVEEESVRWVSKRLGAI